jgi:hypothetical protein
MKKYFVPTMIVVFVALTAAFSGMRMYTPQFNFPLLMTGNTIMLALSLVSYFLITRQLKKRPEAFIRGVYGSSFLKLFVSIIGIITYVIVDKPNIHKPSLFVLLGIYAVYSGVETVLLSRMAKEV